jgi:protein tyrosine phosphatase
LGRKLKNRKSDEEITAEEILDNYINASYIDGPLKEDKDIFIATQGPVACTIEAFWKMIIIENTKLIIALTNLQEENRNKCEQYWPLNEDTPLTVGKFTISLQTEVIILDKAVVQRNIVIEDTKENIRHSVTQLQAICWPDHLAPQEEVGFKMIEIIMSYVQGYRNENRDSPVVVHCRYNIVII